AVLCLALFIAGVDSAWEQKKLKARKMLAVGVAESPASSAGFVRRFYVVEGSNSLYILTSNAIIQECSKKKTKRQQIKLRL
ncbi:hypothetical protein JZU68_10330, partial [bacterium]|nr:hypothetical protein [bacterium]